MVGGRVLVVGQSQDDTPDHTCVGYPVPVKAALPRTKDEHIDEKHAR